MSWAYKKLGDVCDFQNGFAFKSKFFTNSGIPILRISNIQDGRVDLKRMAYTDIGHYKENLERYKVEKGELLIAMSGATTGKIGINHTEMTFLLNQRVGKFIPKKTLDKDYLFYYLSTKVQEHLLISAGAAQPNLSTEQIKSIQIPLPPIPEQQRIVAILDQAFADIEKARANAEKNLKNARELFDSYLNQVFSQRGEGWEEKPWGALCSFVRGPFGGSLKKSMFKESGYSVFEQKHAIHDHIEQFRYFIDEDKFIEMKRFEVKPGEMIMSCSGVTLGRVSVIPNGAPQGIINQALLKLTAKNGTDIHFIKYWIRSPIFQEIIFKHSGGAAQPNVPAAKQLKQITLSIPNIAQQNIVVNEIQSFLQTNRGLIKVYENKIKSLDELKKSLLQKAFSGELTKTEGHAA